MLFWLFVIIFVIGVTVLIVENYYGVIPGWGCSIALVAAWVSGIITLISSIALLFCYIGIDATVAEKQARYEALIYQMENEIYENDNDLGKKELYDEVCEWNEDLAYGKEVMDDFWIGIFYVNEVYENFEFIEYK